MNARRTLARGAVWAALFLAAGCAGRGAREAGPEGPESEAPHAPSKTAGLDLPSDAESTGMDGKWMQRIRKLYLSNDYPRARSELLAFLKSQPNSPWVGYAHNLLGLISLFGKKHLQATHSFTTALDKGGPGSFRDYVRFNLATAQHQARLNTEALETLGQTDASNLDPDTRFKFHYLRAQILDVTGKHADAAAEALLGASRLGGGSDDPVGQRRIGLYERRLTASLGKIRDLATLESLAQSAEDGPFADELLFLVGSRAMDAQRPGLAETYLRRLVREHPETRHYGEAIGLLRLNEGRIRVDPRAIGVLLPMTGKFARYGRRTLEGIELAFRMYNLDEPDNRVTLYVEDCGETTEQAIEALNNLYYEDNVVAVIGPLLSKGSAEVAKQAQDLGVPLLTLTQQQETAGDYVFHGAVAARDQAYAMAHYAVEREGLRRFAILYPDGGFGQEYADNFWNAVVELGAEVVGIEKYPEGETDFRQPVDKLSGLFYSDARSRELRELSRLRSDLQITKRNWKTEKYFDLEPIVDYDAVFIPDDAKTVGQVLPTFAYRDVDKVRFLGVSAWNSPILTQRARKHAEGALFVDVFFQASASKEVRDFVDRFAGTFGGRPGSMEALAYDAASLLDQAMILAGSDPSRSEIRDRLSQIRDFPGVTGKISFTEGRFLRDFRVLTVRGLQITEQAPRVSAR